LVGTVQLQGISRSMALYQNGQQQLAYACSDSYVNIVDVTNPAQMQVLGTFANNLLTTENGNPVAGFQVVACNTYNNDLVLSYSRYDGNTTANPIPTHFAVFSLANPLSPTQVGSVVDIQRPDSLGLYVAGSTALMYQSTTFYDAVDSVVYQETGDVWAGDLSNASSTGAVSYLNDIYSCGGTNPSTGNCNNTTTVQVGSVSAGVCTTIPTQVPNDAYEGGPYRIGPGTAVNGSTTYFASTSASGGNVENPGCPTLTGQLLVVDTSTPSTPKLVTSVSDPAMAFMTGVAVQGSLAIAVGDSLGVFTSNSGYVGTLVVSAFDISTPQSPTLISSITTQLSDSPGSFVVALGNNTFAVGNTSLNGNGILVLVDASNPSALRYMPYSAVLVANPTVAQNGYFFALSATPAATQNALSAFQLSEITGPQVTVSLQLPNSGNAAVDPASFSLAPTSVTTGATYNTYVWNQPAPNTITFNVNVSNVNPGDVPIVVAGGQMAYTLPTLGPGTFVLPAVTVLCQQIVTISPTTNSVSSGGSTATYMVTVSNPTAIAQTFVPSTLGIPSSWGVSLPASITVAPGSNQTFNLTLTPPLNATPEATYNFFVFVSTPPPSITASVGASLIVSGLPSANASNNASTSYSSFTASLNPAAITIGQGGTGMFQVAVTNTGSSTARITLSTANPSSGWTLNFNPSSVLNILPGLSNTATVTGQITIPTGTTAGSYPVTIPVVEGGQTENLSLTVNVVAAGVTASISPSAGNPTTSFSLHLSNVGSVADTYSLSVQGPLMEAASIQSTSGPIPAGQSAQIPIVLKPVNFVTPGSYTLQIQAISQANPAVVAFATATIQVSGSQSVSAVIKPSPASVPTTPATAPLILQVTNTGNMPDNYTAAITNISSNVTANLNGVQSVPAFPIPALSAAEIPLNATLNTGNSGSLTVTVTSTSNMSETAQATVMIGAGSPCDVNQDGKTNILDVQMMVDEALGTDAPNNDLSGDGVVNVVDIQIDINAVLMLGCEAGTVNVTSLKPKSHGATLAQSSIAGTSFGIVARPASIVDLGTLGGSSATAFGLNDLGQIVGSSETGQRAIHAFLWDAGQMTDLDSSDDSSDARNSAAYSINNAVQIAGVYFARERDISGFLYSAGKVTALSQAPHGRASGINNAGQIVGDLATEPASPRQAFLWTAGAVADLVTLGGASSEARAINDSGQIVGTVHLEGSAMHAFLYSGTGLTDLGTLGGKNSVAYGIDNAGEVVGTSQTAENGVRHAFLNRQGGMTDLGTLGGNESQANGINDSGWIVGWSRTAGGGQRAFLWRTGRMVDLNSLISAGAGIWLEEATAINGAGEIVANASNGHAYLITLALESR
jgi:probable HAF family extracellular repeat protein